MRVIDKRVGFVVGIDEARRAGWDVHAADAHKETAFYLALDVKGQPVDSITIEDIGIACRGRIVGRATIDLANGGRVHAVLVQHETGALRAVYLDREASHFVSCEVPK